MAQQAIGMLETKGLSALVVGCDAMLKSASVEFKGWRKVGSGMCSAFVAGEVAAVKAAIESGVAAAKEAGEVINSQVIPRPHDELKNILP
jgi:ethanolamine utilization protein EutM